MINELILLLQTTIICASTLIALRISAHALASLICIQAILANLFVLKQITLFGFQATASDAFMIGSMIGLQLLQEYHGKKIAQQTVFISFFALLFYTVISAIHLLYIPAPLDAAHNHFYSLLQFMPRITCASIIAYVSTSYLDTVLFAFLKTMLSRKYFFMRNTLCILIAQGFDTIIFSFLGLYGIIENIWQIILVSYAIKLIIIIASRPLLVVVKKIKDHSNISF